MTITLVDAHFTNLLQPGKKHMELEKIVAQFDKIEFKNQGTKITVPVDPTQFIPEDTGFYTYQGSLTTPPCSECVIWIVFKQPIEVSNEQVSKIFS